MRDSGEGQRPPASGGAVSRAPSGAADRRRFAEDFLVGELFGLGSHRFEEAAVVAFARRYDAQPFHLDHDAGAASMLGGLAASGWQVVAVLNRAFSESVLAGTHHRGLVAVDRVRWIRPVLAGARLSASARVDSLEGQDRQTGAGAAAGIVRFVVTAWDDAGRNTVEIFRRDRVACFGEAS